MLFDQGIPRVTYLTTGTGKRKSAGHLFQRVSVNRALDGDPISGDQLDLFSSGSITSTTAGAGLVELFELSFEAVSDLNGLQAPDLIPAKLTFAEFVCHKGFLRDNSFMTQVSIEEMQRDLSACLERVEAGETLLIVRAGKPVAEVMRLEWVTPMPVLRPVISRATAQVAMYPVE
jgi:hypothetical protein